MRCVYLEKGARLSGFTVTGGATFDDNANALSDNNSGADICLFLGGAKCPVKHVCNCIAPSEGFIYSDRSGSENHHNIIIAQVETDALYVPAFDSAAANAANMEYVKDFELDGDVYGNPRRSNGGMDIGAVETDWRLRYVSTLGGKISVPEVSWEAIKTPSPGVMLHDGNSMVVEWQFGVSLNRA